MKQKHESLLLHHVGGEGPGESAEVKAEDTQKPEEVAPPPCGIIGADDDQGEGGEEETAETDAELDVY